MNQLDSDNKSGMRSWDELDRLSAIEDPEIQQLIEDVVATKPEWYWEYPLYARARVAAILKARGRDESEVIEAWPALWFDFQQSVIKEARAKANCNVWTGCLSGFYNFFVFYIMILGVIKLLEIITGR